MCLNEAWASLHLGGGGTRDIDWYGVPWHTKPGDLRCWYSPPPPIGGGEVLGAGATRKVRSGRLIDGGLRCGPNSKKTILLKLQIKLVSVQFKVEILHNYALIIYCQLTDLME